MDNNTTQLESNTNTPKTNSGNIKTIIIIILLVLVIGLSVFLAITLTNKPQETKPTPDAPKTSSITVEDYQKARLLTNLILLQRNSSDQLTIGLIPNFESLDAIKNLSEEAKTTIANRYTDEEFPDSSKFKATTTAELTDLQTALGIDTKTDPQAMDFYVITHDFDITKTAEAYKSIFGTDLDLTQKYIRLDYAMPGVEYIYLPNTKALYTGAGGGFVPTASYTYISSIETKDNTLNVNFSMFESQYSLYDEPNFNGTEKCHDDIEHKHTVQCNLYIPDGINSTNYKDLKQYRLVFEKDDSGNLIYKTAEAL